jgi:hypothetical protein
MVHRERDDAAPDGERNCDRENDERVSSRHRPQLWHSFLSGS